MSGEVGPVTQLGLSPVVWIACAGGWAFPEGPGTGASPLHATCFLLTSSVLGRVDVCWE